MVIKNSGKGGRLTGSTRIGADVSKKGKSCQRDKKLITQSNSGSGWDSCRSTFTEGKDLSNKRTFFLTLKRGDAISERIFAES